jgi:hypothetical protein
MNNATAILPQRQIRERVAPPYRVTSHAHEPLPFGGAPRVVYPAN